VIRVETDPPQQPSERNGAIDGFIVWRDKLEKMRSSGHWEMVSIMHMMNHIADMRMYLAPWEWIWCPNRSSRRGWQCSRTWGPSGRSPA
jgi:hypothetical protein